MLTKFHKAIRLSTLLLLSSILYISCQKNVDANANDDTPPGQARLEVRLTDNPNLLLSEVWVDVRAIEIKMEDSTGFITLSGSRPGMYDLIQLTNGRDTLLSNALIPPGRIGQIRLILGTNNFAVTPTGDTVQLSTPSAQQSGLKVNVNQTVAGGTLYRLTLDFDAAKSVVQAGNSGNYILKPVLKVMSFIPSGGNARGIVLPDSVVTTIYAIRGIDTMATTFSNTSMGGAYYFGDIPAGNYVFHYIPQDTIHLSTTRNVGITLGTTTVVDTVRLQH